jgi:hypothetical protein
MLLAASELTTFRVQFQPTNLLLNVRRDPDLDLQELSAPFKLSLLGLNGLRGQVVGMGQEVRDEAVAASGVDLDGLLVGFASVDETLPDGL